MGSILLLIVLLFSFAGGWLLGTIYGPAYAVYGPVTAVLSAGMLVITVSIACSNGLAALGRSKEYFAGEVSYCILSIAGALLLIPIWGLIGAATALLIGSVAASSITACILWSLVQRERANSLNPTSSK
jgi:O-antigen/teichoic acid export membrane protein